MKGKFELVDSPGGGRHYRVPGRPRPVPSVTTVLSIIAKPHLCAWYGKLGLEEARRQLEGAADFGLRLHALLAKIDTAARRPRIPVEFKRHVEVYLDWRGRYLQGDWLAVEEPVYSKRYAFAGTVDRVGELHGGDCPSVIDIKTGDVSPEAGLQLAAYQLALEETTDILPGLGSRLVLHIPREKPDAIRIVEFNGTSDRAAFLHALSLYNHLRR